MIYHELPKIKILKINNNAIQNNQLKTNQNLSKNNKFIIYLIRPVK